MAGQARQAEARARAQARREQIRKQERNRKRRLYGLWSGLGIVVLVVVVVFLVVFPKSTASATKNLNAPASAALVADITRLPASDYTIVGITGQQSSALKAISDAAITTDGKPTFVYVGGEFCPYCAAERWAVVTALSRFGTFTGLETTRSSGADVYPNTPTLSFLTATYTSDYLVLDAKEISDRARNALQPLSSLGAAAEASYAKYGGGGVPYLSLDNKYFTTYQYDPGVLAGKTPDQVGAAIADPSTTISKDVLTAANVLTAGFCTMTDQQPSAVCGAPEVKAAVVGLGTGSTSSGSSAG